MVPCSGFLLKNLCHRSLTAASRQKKAKGCKALSRNTLSVTPRRFPGILAEKVCQLTRDSHIYYNRGAYYEM